MCGYCLIIIIIIIIINNNLYSAVCTKSTSRALSVLSITVVVFIVLTNTLDTSSNSCLLVNFVESSFK